MDKQNSQSDHQVPETHETIRPEDIAETISHLTDKNNPVMPAFTDEHVDWIRMALNERRSLAARQYNPDGSCDTKVTERLHELDKQIDSVSPYILRVLHYLSRIRAIIPALLKMQAEMQVEEEDPQEQMIKQMKYECSKAEAESAIKGMAELHVRPKILDDLAQGRM